MYVTTAGLGVSSRWFCIASAPRGHSIAWVAATTAHVRDTHKDVVQWYTCLVPSVGRSLPCGKNLSTARSVICRPSLTSIISTSASVGLRPLSHSMPM